MANIMTETARLTDLRLVCPACGSSVAGDSSRFRCDCGTPFDLSTEQFPLDGASADELRTRFTERMLAVRGSARSGVWRYRELTLPLAEEQIISHQDIVIGMRSGKL